MALNPSYVSAVQTVDTSEENEFCKRRAAKCTVVTRVEHSLPCGGHSEIHFSVTIPRNSVSILTVSLDCELFLPASLDSTEQWRSKISVLPQGDYNTQIPYI